MSKGVMSRRALTGAIVVSILSLAVMSACNRSSTPAPSTPAPSATQPGAAALPPNLWGDMKPIVSVKELMQYTIDPLGDYIFDAVSTEVSKKGIVEHVPKTQEDWDKVMMGGVSIAEAAYLLKVKRPFAPPGDLNNSVGPDAVELPPAAIMAKVEKDPVEWNARIEALRNVGLATIDVAKRKDVKQLWDAAENLDEACENCHRSYWYPLENDAFYSKIDKRLKDFSAKH